MSRVTAKKNEQERLDAVFSALSDGTRRSIVARLAEGPASVTELAEPFAMSLPAVSKHLRVLEAAKLLRRERDGRFHRCYLEPEALEDASAFIERYSAPIAIRLPCRPARRSSASRSASSPTLQAPR